MRTKFLFSAALLATMFAACTNEDLVAPAIDAVSPTDGRPTVNVKLGLDLGSDATTRLIFDGDKGYQFAVGDQIGALLMDGIAHPTCRPFTNSEEWAKLSWLEKYGLTDYIHTDYPFACTEETTGGGTKWESNAKMLEGNYFFAYPYEGYDAKRQLTHSIIDQKQDGGSLVSAMKSYADNQFFIGYAQIKEGNETKDALTNVSMTSVLGAVRFQLKNIGTRDQKITKIVLSGDNISSVLTFNPLKAEYKGKDAAKTTGTNYNLRGKNGSNQFADNTTIFNYANYMGLEEDDLYENAQYAAATDFVYNIPATEKDNYNRGDALRAVVNTYETGNQNDNYAELALTDNGNEGIVAMANGQNTIEACIMINPITVDGSTSKLLLSIYTTEGLIKDIDLSKVNEEQGAGLKPNTVITDQAVKNVGPEVRNVIGLQFDNNSVQAPAEAKINNSDDLKQYVNWISTLGNKRLNVVELQNSAAIDAETAKLLDKNNIVLYVKALAGSNAKLQIANEAGVEDVLNNIIVDKTCPIEILGTANIGTATLNHNYQALLNDVQQSALTAPWSQNLKIEVAKGGTLNVIGTQLSDNVISTEITNNGTLNIAEDAIITKAKVVNYATMIVDGSITMDASSVNEFKAEITVNEKGMLSGTNANNFTNQGVMNNHGKIWNIINADNGTMKPSTVNIYADATISNFHENKGEIVYDDVLNKEITFDQTPVTDDIRSTVKYTTKYLSTATAKSVSTSELAKYNITDLTLTEGELVSDTGRPDTPVSASKVGYVPADALLKSLIVKGDNITIKGKEYPLLMRGNKTLMQIDGNVKLGTSIIIEGTFDTESYLTGNITVTEKVAIASAGEAVFTGTAPIVFDHSEFTALDCGTIMKGANITITAGKFFAVEAIKGVANTSNSIDAEGTFYVTSVPTSADHISVSGSTNTIIPSLSDK